MSNPCFLQVGVPSSLLPSQSYPPLRDVECLDVLRVRSGKTRLRTLRVGNFISLSFKCDTPFRRVVLRIGHASTPFSFIFTGLCSFLLRHGSCLLSSFNYIISPFSPTQTGDPSLVISTTLPYRSAYARMMGPASPTPDWTCRGCPALLARWELWLQPNLETEIAEFDLSADMQVSCASLRMQ